MNIIKKLVSVFLYVVLASQFIACASGAGGTSEGSTGAAALSLQVEEGATAQSADGFTITLDTLAMAFSSITMGGLISSEDFFVDFATEEEFDIIEVEDLSPGEYEEMSLTLGTGSSLGGSTAFLKSAQGTEVTSTLNDQSIVIVGQATNGGDSCQLNISLLADGETITVGNPDDAHVEVETEEEAEALVILEPEELFTSLNLAGLGCTGDAEITLETGGTNSAEADAVLSALVGAFILSEVGEGDGHNH